MRKLRVAVVGVGALGRRHAENLRGRIVEADLVAVADSNGARAAQIGEELGVERVCATLDDVLDLPDVEAVVIASPSKLHAEAVAAAARAGKHIFCEKPLALTLVQAEAALEAVRKSGVQLQVGFMRRYDPGYAAAHQRIAAGEIGEPMIFKSVGRDRQPPPIEFYQGGTNGTLFITTCIHDFDLARWIMNDEIVSVHSFGAALACPEFARLGDVDSALVNLRFARGAIGNIEALRKSSYGYDVRTEILGTAGAVHVGQLQQTPMRVLTSAGIRHDALDHWLPRFGEAYLIELRDFVQNILADKPVRVTGEDGRRALVIAVAAEQSYREGRAVSIDEAGARPAVSST